MSDLIPENLEAPTNEVPSFVIEGRSIVPTTTTSLRKKNEIGDILTWVECFNSYVAVITSVRPERARDLLAYMALIICIAKQFPGRCWYNYDRAFRLEAAASNMMSWSQIHPDLYHYHTSVTVQSTQPQARRYREPRGDQNSMTTCKSWNSGHAAVHASSVDFTTDAIGMGAGKRIAESTARNSYESESVVLARNQAGGDRPRVISRDGAYSNERFSCFFVQNNFNIPDVSSLTPINVDKFSLQLCGHPDQLKVNYVLSGLHEGFQLGFHPESAKANCPSALEQPAVIADDCLAKEVSLGRVFGPTSVPPLENVQLSRFGVIPKKDGGWRLILDLSFPCRHSVNDGINKEEFTLTYSKVSDAISLIVKTGRGALMGKVDIKSAYRIIPVHPSDCHLLGMFWQGAYYVDLALPFGLHSAPGIFNSVADLFHRCFHLLSWLNNFLFSFILQVYLTCE